jgi:iron complex outermembrane receptor protein
MEATGFYHDYADLRSQEPTPPLGIPIVLRNLFEGRSAGIELAGNYEPYSTWLLHAGYTWQTIDLRPAPGSHDTTDGLSEAQDPQHVFSARSYLDLPKSLEFDLLFRAIGELRGKKTPGYRELDARFGWQATSRLNLSLIGRDLLHHRHAEFASGTTEGRFFQRDVLGRVTWGF